MVRICEEWSAQFNDAPPSKELLVKIFSHIFTEFGTLKRVCFVTRLTQLTVVRILDKIGYYVEEKRPRDEDEGD